MGRAKTAVVLAGGEAADLARVPVPPPDLVVAAIEKVSGKPRDVQAAARIVEARIAADRAGCPDPDVQAPLLQ